MAPTRSVFFLPKMSARTPQANEVKNAPTSRMATIVPISYAVGCKERELGETGSQKETKYSDAAKLLRSLTLWK